nr:MAG TPA: hypothetical protein [Bacteriophage sp.]
MSNYEQMFDLTAILLYNNIVDKSMNFFGKFF